MSQNFLSSIISVNQGKEMYDEYGSNRRVGLIETYEDSQPGVSNFQTTRYAYFELEKIKCYIDYLSELSDKLVAGGKPKIENVRLYFANYPLSSSNNYRGKNTILLAPTTNLNGSEQCFVYKESQGGDIDLATFQQNPTGFESTILNEAGLRPPPPIPPGSYFGE